MMGSLGKALASAGLACCVALAPAMTGAVTWESNPVRREPVHIGPQASRLIVGFRQNADRAIETTVVARRAAAPVAISQAATSSADVAALAARAGLPLARSRQFTPSMHVLYLPNTLYGPAVEAALVKLRADPSVEFAEVDERRYSHAVTPNDPLFMPSADSNGQWYLKTPSATTIELNGNPTQDLAATDAVSAWSITTGSSGIVIADVDTGVRFDHPDLLRAGLGGRLLPGYDFVGEDYNPTSGAALGTFLIANDGDGWDPDPSDPGDWISLTDTENVLFQNDTTASSTWHGTRVIGIVGAITNNEIGIAGFTWGSWVLPVRALGKGGGYDSDIISGIEWAVGLPVTNPDGPPVPKNPFPADIVNLSLGSSGSCPSDYRSVLTQVTGLGVLVVASAGNGSSGGAAAPVDAPANCSVFVPGVLAVVGLRNVGTKVGYSSFGAGASIGAPAGNCVETQGVCLRSIDTTTNLGTTVPGEDSYTNETNPNLGTSFSAPIVSGIAGLMRSVNYNLTPAQIAALLQGSATAFPAGAAGVPTCPTVDATSGECACPNDGSQCGAGMANALQAVEAAQKPIGVIVLPKSIAAGAVINASGSVAACNTSGATPSPLDIATFRWSASPASIIESGASSAQVTINPVPGTLTLTITDSAGNTDTETVLLTSSSAKSSAPSSAGTRASACPTPLAVNPVAPSVSASFSPAAVARSAVSTLTLTLVNTNGFALTQSSLSVSLPENLTAAAGATAATTCTGAALALGSTTNSVRLLGANIPAQGNCTISLPVQSAVVGSYEVSVAARTLDTAPAGGNASSSSATLTVSAPSGGGGGGDMDWIDILIIAAALLALRRPALKRVGRNGERRRR
jgi:serine protease